MSDDNYYFEQDICWAYIKKNVNPARKENGLDEISYSQAMACFRILWNFHKKWIGENYVSQPV